MKFIKANAPFTTGNHSEVVENVTRIYTVDGFPLIEVFGSQEVADDICTALNEIAEITP